MYFLEQVRKQFLSNLVSYAGETEWAWEQVESEASQNINAPKVEATPWEVLDHAQATTGNLNTAVAEQEDLGLIKPQISPETQAFIDTSKAPEGRDLSSPAAAAAYKELWLEQTQATINTDALTEWETPEEYVESTTQELQWSLNEIDAERKNISDQIDNLPAGSPERNALEKKQSFLDGLFSSVEWVMNGSEISWDGPLGVAQKYIGIHEDSGEADKFLMWMAQSARTTPWCAGFVSAVCKEAWYENVTPTLSSRALIGQTGKWHVAFNVWNGQMLGWNQWNKVSVVNIKKDVEGWVMPEHAWNPDKTYTRENNNVPSGMTGKDVFDPANIPVWAIIVFKRNESHTQEK